MFDLRGRDFGRWFAIIAFIAMTNHNSFAQFYVSPKACISDLTTNPSTGQVQGCEQTTLFFDENLSSTAWQWDFGDGNGSSLRNPKYNYTTPGDYQVNLTRTLSDGTIETVSKNIKVGNLPQQPLFNRKQSADTTVCDGKSLTLNPFNLSLVAGNYSYLWFPGGETTQTITVDTSGCYSVEVIDNQTGCSRTAKINVKFCLQEAPSGGGSEQWYLGDGSVIRFDLNGTETERDTLSPEGDVIFDPELEDISFNAILANTTHPLQANSSIAMVYDPKGNLAFYSDGKKIFEGRNDEEIPMVDGSPFPGMGGPNSKAVAIIPKPSCNECPHHQYYLVSYDEDNQLLSYSVLDLRYNNRQGAVTELNVPLLYPVNGQISVKKNAEESGFLIFSHEPDTNKFNIINVDSTGINVSEQLIGTNQSLPENEKTVSRIAPNGRRFAQSVVIGGRNFVEVFNINQDGFTLDNPLLLDLDIASPPIINSIEFSENSDILYVSVGGDPNLGQTSYLIQFALFLGNAADISSQKEIIASSTTQTFGSLSLGPRESDGLKYLYLNIPGLSYMPFIQSPDVRGNADAIGYSDRPSNALRGITLAGNAPIGLPIIVKANPEQDGDGLSANYSGNCFQAPTILTTQGVCDPLRNKIEWVFEDGTVLEGKNVSYTFPKLGWNKFKVRVTIFNQSPLQGIVNSPQVNQLLETKCDVKEIEADIYIKPSPILSLPEEFYVCFVEGENKTLGPAPKGGDTFTYDWMTSLGTSLSRDSAYQFVALGIYKIEVKNNFDCATSDQLDVKEGCEPRIFVPDAFTPNGDGRNDDLIINYAHILNFELKVFNRWGEIIFVTDQPDIRWNGMVKNKVFGNQLYPYVINYRSRYFPERGLLTKKGAVYVIR